MRPETRFVRHLQSSRCTPLATAVLFAALAAFPLAGQAEESQFYERALAHFDAGRHSAAVVELKNALQADPDFLPAHTLYARLLLQIGATAVAAEALSNARRLGADPAVTWPLQARVLLLERKHEELLATVPVQGFPDPVTAELRLLRGHAEAALGRVNEAQKSYTSSASLAPTSPDPLVALARLALQRGDPRAADNWSVLAIEVAPESADSWEARGAVLHARGEPQAALAAFGNAIARAPDHLPSLVSRAGILVELGRYEEARAVVDALGERAAEDPRLYYLRAVLHAFEGRREEARAHLVKAAAALKSLGTETVYESGQLLLLAGVAHMEIGQLEQAQDYLERYIERFPERRDAQVLLANLMMRRGEAQQAVSLLEEVLAKVAPTPRLLSRLAAAYSALGRPDLARGYLEQAHAEAPDDVRIEIQLAHSLLETGVDEAQAVNTLRRLFDAAPRERVAVGAHLASYLMRNRRFDEALELTGRLVELAPENEQYFNLHGSALSVTGDSVAGALAFEAALNLVSGYVSARVNLSRNLRDRGDPDQARVVLEEGLSIAPDDADLLAELGTLEASMGNEEAAMRWLLKARDTSPGSVAIVLALARVQLARGRAAEAVATVEQGLSVSPEHFELLAMLARAEVALGHPDKAKAIYLRMSRQAGFDVRRQYPIARQQAALEAYSDAQYSLYKGLKHRPDHVPSRVLNIEMLSIEGRTEDALAAAVALRAERPELAAAHRLEGQLLSAVGRLDEAQAALARAQTLEPSIRHVLALSKVLVKAGERDAATGLLRDWQQRNPTDPLADIALADHYMVGRQYALAEQHLRGGIRKGGESASVLNNLAYVLARQGKPEALEVGRRAYDANPTSADIADTLGWALVHQGQPVEGLRFLREAQARAASDPNIRFHIAEALHALGRRDRAVDELRSVLASSTDFASADEARHLLQKLTDE